MKNFAQYAAVVERETTMERDLENAGTEEKTKEERDWERSKQTFVIQYCIQSLIWLALAGVFGYGAFGFPWAPCYTYPGFKEGQIVQADYSQEWSKMKDQESKYPGMDKEFMERYGLSEDVSTQLFDTVNVTFYVLVGCGFVMINLSSFFALAPRGLAFDEVEITKKNCMVAFCLSGLPSLVLLGSAIWIPIVLFSDKVRFCSGFTQVTFDSGETMVIE